MSASRLAGLDHLRGGAAFCVAVPHFFIFAGIHARLFEAISVLGVEVFFVLSGFVLAPQILSFTIERPSVANLGIFLVRRWMRTIPAYVLALLVISMMQRELSLGDLTRYLLYAQNLFSPSNASDYYSVAWSLSVEEWFYLTFPLYLTGALLLLRKRSTISVLLLALAYIVVVTTFRETLGNYAHWGNDVRRVVAFRVDSIAWGFLLGMALNRATWLKAVPISALVGAFFAMIAISLGLTLAISEGHSLISHFFPFYAATLGALGIVFAVRLEPAVARRPRLQAAGLVAGKISYSVYLFHLIVLAALSERVAVSWPTLFVVYTAATVGIAALVYIAVESPILAARPKFRADAGSRIEDLVSHDSAGDARTA